jgi:hypothetical protein
MLRSIMKVAIVVLRLLDVFLDVVTGSATWTER